MSTDPNAMRSYFTANTTNVALSRRSQYQPSQRPMVLVQRDGYKST